MHILTAAMSDPDAKPLTAAESILAVPVGYASLWADGPSNCAALQPAAAIAARIAVSRPVGTLPWYVIRNPFDERPCRTPLSNDLPAVHDYETGESTHGCTDALCRVCGRAVASH
ncbi:hypothetical protein [Cellulomonas fengjieae]|uniref:Uncharacterized protein n=1 Tax=Cellulomonas fengjieae TaxID=2819978 RepID=A0ABS3SGL9_9CELL|nr:hypothetical protein [Cellulomonas fengjieae]MBO3084111.1 hypothetical protein [Cellulomonas fengjieae]QVI64634.1 hypothetical protein KG102_10600 [Cellulomonas fengjieae]